MPENRALIDRVRSFDRDVAAYERLVADDLARARADLALAKEALTGLLVEGAPGASPDDEPLDQRAPRSLSSP